MFPSDGRPQIARASQLLGQNRLAEAEREAQAALAAYGYRCGEALFLLGLVRASQHKLDEAVTLMGKAMGLLPPHAYLRFSYGRALALTGQAEAAIGQFAQSVRLMPDMTEAWYALGGMQVQRGRFAEAEQSFRRVQALAPQHGENLLALGAAMLEQGRAAEAQAVLENALRGRHHPGLAAGMTHNLALAQNRQGRKEDALASIARAESLDPQIRLQGLRGEILADLHRFDEALAAMRAAIEAAPQDESLHKTYNDLLYMLGRDRDAAFLASYDLVPDNAALQHAKARHLLMARRDAEALEIFQRLLAREPGHAQAAIGAANALDMMGRHDDAAHVLDQALAQQRTSAVLHNARAGTALFQREPDRAANLAQRALALSPHYQHALANLGTAWRLLDDARDEALNGYDTLIGVFDLDPPEGFSSMEAFNAELLGELDRLHPPAREFLDQSLRGGTQTRGALFDAHHRLVQGLKARIDQAVATYIAGLQDDAAHPFLARRAGSFAYSGSWSSRLGDSGFHVNHIHPEGWISSCYYAGVPDAVNDAEARQGWLTFGEPRFGHGLSWRHALKPVTGRLVLFPSYMWHGTIGFRAPTPRTTIAFDVVPTL
jgi:tetratricopeptide (TPR) repeat protein